MCACLIFMVWGDSNYKQTHYHYIPLLLLKQELPYASYGPHMFLYLCTIHLYYHTQWAYGQGNYDSDI